MESFTNYYYIKSKRPKILVIEDDPIAQMLCEFYLKELECQFHVVSTGKEALGLLQSSTDTDTDVYDGILMDLGLPDFDGKNVIKTIRHLESKRANPKRTPLIVLTAHAIDSTRNACLAMGADAIIIKPIEIEELKKLFKELKILDF